MAKIDKLLVKAEKWSIAFQNAHISAFQAAHSLRGQYANFLEADGNRVNFFELDRNLEKPPHHELKRAPILRIGADGVFYFGLSVNLLMGSQGLEEFIKLGVIRHGTTIHFSCHGNTFESPLHEPPVRLMEYLFDTSLKQLEEPAVGRPAMSIGFLNSYEPKAVDQPPVA